MYSKRVAIYFLVIALVAGAVFLKEYLGIFALAALTSLIFTPLHDWLGKRKKRIATPLTLLAIILSFLIPIFTLIGLSFYEANQAVDDIKQHQLKGNDLDHFTKNINETAKDLGINISRDSIRDKVSELSKKVVPGILDFIFRTVGNVASFVTSLIVYLMVLTTMLSRKYELIRLFKRLSPFDDSIDKEYLTRVKSMSISMVKGTLVIALVVAFISSATLWIIGFPYIAFWFLLFTIMSLIPLGAGIIYVPIGIIMMLTGHIWQGLLILLVQFVVLNNIDNVLRPRLAPKESKLPGVLVLVSTFAGVGYFGIVGVVYGPVIMVLIYTTLEMYDKHKSKGIPLKEAVT